MLFLALTLIINFLVTWFSIYTINSYGFVLFLLCPISMGFLPGYFIVRPGDQHKSFDFFRYGLIALFFYYLGIFMFAMEGVICLAMALPLALLFVYFGSLISKSFHASSYKSDVLPVLFMLSLPFLSFAEKDFMPDLTQVSTEIVIDAPIDQVWEHIIVFPELDAPTEYLFKTGISYPLNATIEGSGVGAIRRCNFTTGSFVEPITVWNPSHLLAFDVLEQPAPLKELSIYDLHAPHIDDYFVSKKGEFRLTSLSANQTLVVGTTWYYHKIKPVAYWELWSTYILHKIHQRVLNHIKTQSEIEVHVS